MAKAIMIGRRAYLALNSGDGGHGAMNSLLGKPEVLDALIAEGLAEWREERNHRGVYLTSLGVQMLAEGARTSNGGRVLKVTS